MFDKLIEIAVKSALESQEIKDRLKNINNLEQEKKNKIIDIGKDSYRVLN